MLDVSRHFMPKHDVLRFIDLAAMHRRNVLHWHLTDDQGWRIEIKPYPKLTSVGAWRHESQVGAQLGCHRGGIPPESGPLSWQLRPGIPGRPTSLQQWDAFIAGLVDNIREQVLPGTSLRSR